MYPAPLQEVHAPTTLEACLDLLAAGGEDAKPLAGGQSLMPLLKLRLARPSVLIDLNRLRELSGLGEVLRPPDERRLVVGALTRHRALASHPLVAARYPALADAAGVIGDVQVRNRGTIGGSLAHADPAADLPVPLLALGASVRLKSKRGERTLRLDAFLKGVLATDLAPDELLTAVEVPAPLDGEGSAYAKFGHVFGDFAVVSVGAWLRLEAGRVSALRIFVGGVLPRPQEGRGAAAVLLGEAPDPARIAEAAAVLAEEIDVQDDARASAAYRRTLIRHQAAGVLARALRRSRGEV